MKALFARLFPPPLQRVDDPVLGPLAWDDAARAWRSPPVAAARPYRFLIERHKRDVAPPDACLRIAHALVADPGRLDWLLGVALSAEAERRPEPMRAAILALAIDRISLRAAEDCVRGDMDLDGTGPLQGWFCWHVDGTPIGVAQPSSS